MTNDQLGPLKEQVLSLFRKNPKQQFKPKEISRRLSIQGDEEYKLLLQALHELAEEEEIGRHRRKRYGYQIPPSQRVQGTLMMTRQGHGIVNILPPKSGRVLVMPRSLATALNGDTVSVALFAEATSDAAEEKLTEGMFEGEIVEVLERANLPVVGTFQKTKNFFIVIPDDARMGQDIIIPKGKTKGARPGQKVVAVIEEWESRHFAPEGRVEEVLGQAGEVSAEMASVARQFQLPLAFPKDILKEADEISETIPEEECRKRLDLRKTVCFTIDPENAKDFDDAVSLEILEDGNYKLGVHIADVSHYVREGTKLDREAYLRGTSVYLADDVIPMLPEKISNNLCSLRPHVDRLTYSAIMVVSPRGAVKDYEIVKSVIHSKRRFTYEEVQQIIETGKGDFAETVLAMHKLSKILLAKRMREGSIDFDSVETKFRFDEDGKPTEIIKKERLEAHRLVEDFMLMANQIVARHIGLAKKEENVRPFVYRIHDQPPPEKLQDLAEFVAHLGYKLSIDGGVTSRALQKLLADIKGKDEEKVINQVAIRSMAKAVYSETNIGHFGLGFKYYTHFTSPIRRYPDLIVHRLLDAYSHRLAQKKREQIGGSLEEICRYSSERERVAMEAERASVKVMQVEYMKRHVGDEFHGIISGVMKFGLFVEITDLLVEGLIKVRDMEDDFYVYDEKRYTFTGRRSKKRYRLGDKVMVRVVRVDPEEREIDFALVEEQASTQQNHRRRRTR